MNGSPMGTMTGWINTEAEIGHDDSGPGRDARPARGVSILDRIFGRNHELARNSEQTMRFLVAGENA